MYMCVLVNHGFVENVIHIAEYFICVLSNSKSIVMLKY